MVEGESPYCALMQVAAADTHTDYVLCRGYDTRIKRFIDYEAANEDKPGIAVAKPYGSRVVGYYNIGEVYPALLPLWRLGQNPGVVEAASDEIQGQPVDLNDVVENLTDDDGVYINWMLLDSGGGGDIAIGKTNGTIAARIGTTPGYGEVSLYRLDTGILTDTGEDVDVKTLSDVPLADDEYVELLHAAGVWWVISARSGATRVRGKLVADCTGGGFNMDNLVGINGLIDETSLSGCTNPAAMDGDEGGAVWVEWNIATEKWEAYQMECPEPPA